MNLGLIGPGRHGSRYLQENNGGRYFTRVLSRTPRTDLPEWVKGTTDPEEFFAPGLDGVVIATPTDAHHEVALRALRGGLHVLCEKPLAGSWSECKELIDNAEGHRRALLVAHTDLFHPKWFGPVSSGRLWARYGVLTRPERAVVYEWMPHLVACAMDAAHYTDIGSIWWGHDEYRCSLEIHCPRFDADLAVCGINVVKKRRVYAQTGSRLMRFDGVDPSDPSPIRNMLDVFTSGKPDRRMSYDFTRAVYRVLLTDPD